MKKRILLVLVFAILIALCFSTRAFASTDLDEIESFTITVDPRMTDRNIRY